MSNPSWKSDFSTNYQVKKGITTEESLQEIEDAAANGVTVKPAASGAPAAAGAAPAGTVVKVVAPAVKIGDKAPVTLTSAIRAAQGVEAATAAGAPPADNKALELLKQAQAKQARKPMIDLTK